MMGKTHYATGALFTAALGPPTATMIGLDIGPAEMAVGVGIGTIAGVLPDIDHPESMITKGLLPGSKVFGPISKILGWFLSIPPRFIGVGARATMNHRGGTHSVVFMLGWTLLAAPIYAAMIAGFAFVLSALMPILSTVLFEPILGHGLNFNPGDVVDWLVVHTPSVMPLVMISVFFGYLAHLVSDSMTKVPVPWPWPFSKKRYCILPKPLRITTDSFVERGLIRPIVILLATAAFVINIGIPLADQVLNKTQTEQDQQPAKQNSQPRIDR